MTDNPPPEKVVHDVMNRLRADGYEVGLNAGDYVDAFPEHVQETKRQLDAEDLRACFLVAYREGHTDYSSAVSVDDSVAWGVIQIQMLGAHFRTVLDALSLSTTDLVSAMVDEALAVDELEEADDRP